MEFKIPCDVKQYRYLNKLFGKRLSLPHSHPIAKYTFNIIKNTRNVVCVENDPKWVHLYPIDVPIWVFTKYGITEVNPVSAMLINQYLLDKFKESFYLRLHELVYISEPKIKIIQAIYMLSEEFGIDEDVDPETIKKEYYRYRQIHTNIFKKNTPINVLNVRTQSVSAHDDRFEFRINSDILTLLKKKAKQQNLDTSAVIHHLINTYLND